MNQQRIIFQTTTRVVDGV